MFFFFSSRRRHTRLQGDWSSDVCSSDLWPHPNSKPTASSTSANGSGFSLRVATRGSWSSSRRATATKSRDRKSTRLNSSHLVISYAVFCLKKKKRKNTEQ